MVPGTDAPPGGVAADGDSARPARDGRQGLHPSLVGALGVLAGALLPIATYVAVRARPPPAATAPAPAPSPAAATTCDPPAPAASRCADALALLGGVRVGTPLDRWRVLGIRAAPEGAVSVEMAGADDVPFVIEVRRRDPAAPRAPAETPALSLYIARVAAGSPTREEHGLGARALAARVAAAGSAPPGWLRPLPAASARSRP